MNRPQPGPVVEEPRNPARAGPGREVAAVAASVAAFAGSAAAVVGAGPWG